MPKPTREQESFDKSNQADAPPQPPPIESGSKFQPFNEVAKFLMEHYDLTREMIDKQVIPYLQKNTRARDEDTSDVKNSAWHAKKFGNTVIILKRKMGPKVLWYELTLSKVKKLNRAKVPIGMLLKTAQDAEPFMEPQLVVAVAEVLENHVAALQEISRAAHDSIAATDEQQIDKIGDNE